MNLLRLIGQHTLNEPDAPMRHSAKRRRIKTVFKECDKLGQNQLQFRKKIAPRSAKSSETVVSSVGDADGGLVLAIS